MDTETSFYNQTAPAGEGTPAPAAQVPSQPVAPQVPEQITSTQLKALKEEILRENQSLFDKGMGRVDKKVAEASSKADEAIKTLEASGIVMTEGQKAQVKRTAIDQAYVQQSDPASSPREQSSLPRGETVAERVNRKIYEAAQEAGVDLRTEDLAAYTNLDEFDFVSKAKEVIQAKRMSMAQSGLPTQVPTGQAPNGPDSLRNDYAAQRKLISEGKHPTIRRGDAAGISDLYADFVQRGMKGQI